MQRAHTHTHTHTHTRTHAAHSDTGSRHCVSQNLCCDNETACQGCGDPRKLGYARVHSPDSELDRDVEVAQDGGEIGRDPGTAEGVVEPYSGQ